MSDDSSLTILFQKPNLTSWQKERIKQQSEKSEETPERRIFEKLCLFNCFFRPKSRTQQNQQKVDTESLTPKIYVYHTTFEFALLEYSAICLHKCVRFYGIEGPLEWENVASSMREHFDRHRGDEGQWHCIVGRDFGFAVRNRDAIIHMAVEHDDGEIHAYLFQDSALSANAQRVGIEEFCEKIISIRSITDSSDFQIFDTTMPEKLQRVVMIKTEVIVQSFNNETEELKEGEKALITSQLRDSFMCFFGLDWQCFAGKEFSTSLNPNDGTYIYYRYKQWEIILYQTGCFLDGN